MNKISPTTLVLLLSLGLSTVVALILAYFQIKTEEILIVSVLFGLFSFSLSYFLIKTYLHKKLANIYKIIYPQEPYLKATSILQQDQIEAEIYAYALSRKEEVSTMKLREHYQKEFIGNLAHELKTPAFNIQGYLLTLLEGGIDDTRINLKYLERAEKSLDRMLQILEDLDTMSKFDYDQITIHLQRVNLNDMLQEILDEFNLSIQKSFTQLIVNIPLETDVYIDKKLIKQVFINLLNNSIKYGKEKGKIKIETAQLQDKYIISVSDDGPGIASKHLPRLFERFYRVEESRSRNLGGSGLGLSIVKSIIEKHGQTITVTSEIGKGTTFSFALQKG
jgi:two-component system phosphate regulon sensor histidine kinase PhoR